MVITFKTRFLSAGDAGCAIPGVCRRMQQICKGDGLLLCRGLPSSKVRSGTYNRRTSELLWMLCPESYIVPPGYAKGPQPYHNSPYWNLPLDLLAELICYNADMYKRLRQ